MLGLGPCVCNTEAPMKLHTKLGWEDKNLEFILGTLAYTEALKNSSIYMYIYIYIYALDLKGFFKSWTCKSQKENVEKGLFEA
jgi:hypothetical protein